MDRIQDRRRDKRHHLFADAGNPSICLYVIDRDLPDHQIGGVSQQQGSGGSLTFTSQHGTVSISQLPVVAVDGEPTKAREPRQAPAPISQPEPTRAEPAQESDIFAKIERLADLRQKGILSPEEFATKKAELLSRL